MFQDQLSASYAHYLAEQLVQSLAADNKVHSTQISG